MEKENKKLRDKHVKKERSRLIKLAELAYKLDPRVKKYKEEEELEKKRKKQEFKDKKDRERKEIEDKIREQEEAKQREVQKQLDEEKRLKDEKDALTKKRVTLIKELGSLLSQKFPSSKYDKFFLEEF